MTYINIYIGNVDNIDNVSFIFGNSFEMFPRNTI